MQIRVANESDAPAIAALHAASWRVAYRGALSDEYLAGDIVADRNAIWAERFRTSHPNQYVVVAVIENQIVGFACAYSENDPERGTLLDNIHVSLACQRCSIGTHLMRSVASWCLDNQPHRGLFLWVLQSNYSAQRFYEKLGAAVHGTDTWSPPGGGTLPRYRYAWPDVHVLFNKCG
jgi:ribosomal protein S18 acetylase RimI-like enzyme